MNCTRAQPSRGPERLRLPTRANGCGLRSLVSSALAVFAATVTEAALIESKNDQGVVRRGFLEGGGRDDRVVRRKELRRQDFPWGQAVSRISPASRLKSLSVAVSRDRSTAPTPVRPARAAAEDRGFDRRRRMQRPDAAPRRRLQSGRRVRMCARSGRTRPAAAAHCRIKFAAGCCALSRESTRRVRGKCAATKTNE